MKKNHYFWMVMFLSTLILNACKEKLEVPTVLTNNITSIEQLSAMSGGEIISNGGATVSSTGVCWNTAGNPTIHDSKTTDRVSDKLFISKLTNLQPSTTYYVRAYATNSEGVGYGRQLSFKTAEIIKAQILIQSPENVTSGYIELIRGEIVSDGGAPITEVGFVWSTKGEPTVDDVRLKADLLGEKFSSKIENLLPDSSYFIRAYAQNKAGISYSVQYHEVKMLPVATDISIIQTDSITEDAVKVTATATSGDKFNPITERGILWSLKPDSIVAENYVVGVATADEFITIVKNLQPKTRYFLTPYAKNKFGIKYGNEKEILTYTAK